jgi:GTP-binding protein
MQGGCATLVVLNKWDISATDLEDARARVNQKLRLRPPLIASSALTGRNVPVLLSTALQLADRAATRVPTPELNRFVGEIVARRPPPAKRGRRLRLYYSAQVGVSPPRIAIQVNDRRLVSRDWVFHLENRLREHYGWEGVPLIIDLMPKRARGSRGRSRKPEDVQL